MKNKRQKRAEPDRGLNPLAPKARIIPRDHQAYTCSKKFTFETFRLSV
jgi:hypothetical protein